MARGTYSLAASRCFGYNIATDWQLGYVVEQGSFYEANEADLSNRRASDTGAVVHSALSRGYLERSAYDLARNLDTRLGYLFSRIF